MEVRTHTHTHTHTAEEFTGLWKGSGKRSGRFPEGLRRLPVGETITPRKLSSMLYDDLDGWDGGGEGGGERKVQKGRDSIHIPDFGLPRWR